MKTGSWSAHGPAGASEKLLSNALGVCEITAGLLLNRGLESPADCRKFFSPSIEDLHDPFGMKDMEAAAGMVRDAAASGKKIIVYGDYDVDGLTAAAILVRSLRAEGADADYYMPHRVHEGYGLNERAVARAASLGAGLILTVDCGINSFSEVMLARRLGIKIVVTDHHEQDAVALPPADALVNPRQSACRYPFKPLSGAGVAFKLAAALFGPAKASEFLDLAALGSVADSVPLAGENRIIVKLGIEALQRTKNPGLRALIETSGIEGRKLTARDLAFSLAPRLNAPGRIDSAESSMELLITDDPRAACSRAQILEEYNRKRRRIQKAIFESAEGKLRNSDLDSIIALADKEWHPGLIGIIASRISELYSRPAVLISADSEICRGSARCGESFHMLSALAGCRKLLGSLGGHSQAAGFSIKRRNIPRFLKSIKSARPENGSPAPDFILADREITFGEITMDLLHELPKFQPCGEGNPEPLFISREVEFTGIRRLRNGHVKMRAGQGGFSFDCIGFGMYEEKIGSARRGDLLYSPEINSWNGRREIQLVLKDIKI